MVKEDVEIVLTIVDETLSYIPWGGDNILPVGIKHFGFAVSVIILNEDATKIVRLIRKEAGRFRNL